MPTQEVLSENFSYMPNDIMSSFSKRDQDTPFPEDELATFMSVLTIII